MIGKISVLKNTCFMGFSFSDDKGNTILYEKVDEDNNIESIIERIVMIIKYLNIGKVRVILDEEETELKNEICYILECNSIKCITNNNINQKTYVKTKTLD